jgi:uncharacterized protein (TIGR02145 family)
VIQLAKRMINNPKIKLNMKNRLLIYSSVLIGLTSLFICNCKKDNSNTTDKSTGFCLDSAPIKDSVLFRLKTFSFDGKDTASLVEAEKILKFICPDADIHYPTKLTVCGKFKSGYHLTLWADAYGKKDRYSARYGTEENHSFFGSNDTYFVIVKPVGFTAITNSATSVTMNSAILNGTVNANNLSTTVSFDYGTSSSYGNSVYAAANTISSNENIDVNVSITGLSDNTTYHFRVKAVNSSGTKFGSDKTFTTTNTESNSIIFNPNLTYGSVSDNDGNTYRTITIGTQTWMAENLKTTKYRNGDLIGTTTPATLDISSNLTPKYQWSYDGNESNVVIYGRLYTFSVITDSRNICPIGWHVPTHEEWTTLVSYIGDMEFGAGKLKETGTTHWLDINNGATNINGFTALPGGYRNNDGSFLAIGQIGSWWTSTELSAYVGEFWEMYSGAQYIANNSDVLGGGHSVRCVKNQ